MRTVTTFAEVAAAGGGAVGLVPTMGYFHEGHLSLMAAARSRSDSLVVSLFVNPLQFDVGTDLDRYPRDVERDAALAAEAGADVLFVPSVEHMYPEPPLTRVEVAGITEHLEGAFRPGHFAGVATVVAKLFAGIRPDRAFFGRKDAQQLAVIRRVAFDLSMPVEVIGVPIVREQDGLALSSRNVHLATDERDRALSISGGLLAAEALIAAGERRASVLQESVRASCADRVEVEYVSLAAAESVELLEVLDRSAFLAVAAQVGSVRLIDNLQCEVGPDGSVRTEFGVRLDGPSALYA